MKKIFTLLALTIAFTVVHKPILILEQNLLIRTLQVFIIAHLDINL